MMILARLLLAAALLASCGAWAQASDSGSRDMNSAQVQDWADRLFTEAARTNRFSGAVVSFVQGGELRFAKGYGYADYVKGTPVDAAKTRFSIGSITKVFTGTAIAQLLDQGLIDSLQDPANKYLQRIQLPEQNGHAVTLEQLLTHRGGFESRIFNLMTDTSHDLPLSSEALRRFELELINEPGRYTSYNNYGTSVPALIVEDLSGLPIADYFEKHIFAPLGMRDTVLNMTPDPTPRLGIAYGFLPSGKPLAFPHRSVHPFFAPVGGIDTTAGDMGRFLLANLRAGRGDSDAILSPAGFQRLHRRISGAHEYSTGFAMIYMTWDWNGYRVVMHGGNLPGRQSGMLFVPELDAGLFFSLMSGYPEIPVLESLLGSERLEPASDAPETPLSNAGVLINFLETFLGEWDLPEKTAFSPGDPADYTGVYLGQNAAYGSMEKLMLLLNDQVRVTVSAAQGGDESGEGVGGLVINGRGPYREVAPDVFYSDAVTNTLGGYFLDSPWYFFSRDAQGRVDYLTTQIGFDSWKKIAPWQDPLVYAGMWVIFLLVAVTGLLFLFYPKQDGQAALRWLPPLVAVAVLAMPAVLIVGNAADNTLVDQLFFGRTGRFTVVAVLAHVAALLALWEIWLAVKLWRGRASGDGPGRTALRLHFSAVALAALGMVPVFVFFNLLLP